MDSYENFRNKYSLTDWVLTNNKLVYGDILAFMKDGKEVKAKVIHIPEDFSTVKVYLLDSHQIEMINIGHNVCYLCNDDCDNGECTCGAKHTSRPDYHLVYCDLNKRR